MYSCLVLEDEPGSVHQLTEYIQQLDFLTPLPLCQTASQARSILMNTPVDLFFIDSPLPTTLGYEFINSLRHKPAVIVSSAHTGYALDWFDLDIADYLVKPYDYGRFIRSVNRSILKIAPPLPKPASLASELIYFKSGRRIEKFQLGDILYIEAYGIYAKIHTLHGPVTINQRISDLASKLRPDQFVRIHKSYIANITSLKRLESKHLWVNEIKLPIGITYRETVHANLKRLGIIETVYGKAR